MSHLKYLVKGGKDAIQRFIMTPFEEDHELTYEMVAMWDPQAFKNQYRIKAIKAEHLKRKIADPEKSVLYVLAHSGSGATTISAKSGGEMEPKELVDFLVKNGLPEKILAIKIWACFSGMNGFAQAVRSEFLKLNRGYNPIIIGYTEALGGRGDTDDEERNATRAKHVWEVNSAGERGRNLGRARDYQAIFAGAPPNTNAVFDDYDDITDEDILNLATPPSPLSHGFKPLPKLPPRQLNPATPASPSTSHRFKPLPVRPTRNR